jgi:hypothetical protein
MRKPVIQLGETFYDSPISIEEWEAMEAVLQRTKLTDALDSFKQEKITELRAQISESKDGRLIEGYIQALEDIADLIESGIHNAIENYKDRTENIS